MARPKISLDDLPPDWMGKTIEIASFGGSDVEIRVDALGGICHETWTRLLNEEPQFTETIKRARDLCQLWWERQGRISLRDDKFSPTLWYMNMKNRFGWRDKVENETYGKDGGAIEQSITVKYVDSNE